MPTWSDILGHTATVLDTTRRSFLKQYSDHVERDVILYTSAWSRPAADLNAVSIGHADIPGFMETVYGLKRRELDLIVHSPGGSAQAAEQIVNYLRRKFDHIRAVIPQAAMSAATMLACGCDEIVMGKQSCLGPTDPQFVLQTQLGLQMVPAQAILDQFDQARADILGNPNLGPLWYPILSQYGPALLQQARNEIDLSAKLVATWLARYMFGGHPPADARRLANGAARRLASLQRHKTHGRPIDRDTARDFGLAVTDLEADQTMQDLVLTVFHSANLTFDQTAAVKIIENQNSRAYIIMQRQQRT